MLRGIVGRETKSARSSDWESNGIQRYRTQPGMARLVTRYGKWRRIYSLAARMPRDEPVWEHGRLHLRAGYPRPGWTGYVIKPEGEGCSVFTVTRERSNQPLESLCGVFSSIDDAGRYITLKVGEALRIRLRLDPVEWAWEDAGLNHHVRQVSLGRYVTKFELKDDPARSLVLQVDGVQAGERTSGSDI